LKQKPPFGAAHKKGFDCMTREKMYEIIDSIIGDAISAIDARRKDVLLIAGECIDQEPETGYNSESVELLHDLLRVDNGEELMQWLSDYYGEAAHPHKTKAFHPMFKEDFED